MERFKTLGQLERYLIAYMEQHECSVALTIRDNKELIRNHIDLFRLSNAEIKEMRCETKEEAKYFVLSGYLNERLLYYKSCRSINAYKKYLLGD